MNGAPRLGINLLTACVDQVEMRCLAQVQRTEKAGQPLTFVERWWADTEETCCMQFMMFHDL